jgi:hypothetical protein
LVSELKKPAGSQTAVFGEFHYSFEEVTSADQLGGICPFPIREHEGRVQVACPNDKKGLIIGRKGWKIKALERGLGQQVKFVPVKVVRSPIDTRGRTKVFYIPSWDPEYRSPEEEKNHFQKAQEAQARWSAWAKEMVQGSTPLTEGDLTPPFPDPGFKSRVAYGSLQRISEKSGATVNSWTL